MNASSASTLSLLASDTPRCPQCARAMDPCELEGHYGQRVPTDICPHCNLVWFDEFESVRLSGLGWVRLLRRMQAAMDGAFSLLLAERGLVRPLAHADRLALAQEGREPCCLNCGGPIQGGAETCTFCASPLVVIDMPRLMMALLMRHAEPLPEESAQRVAWPCRGCGAPLAPNETARCERCHHQVVVPSVLDLRPLLDKVEPLLRAALPRAARPHGEKLRAMRGNPDATAFHRYVRHFSDMTDTRGVSGWITIGLVAAAVWYFWF